MATNPMQKKSEKFIYIRSVNYFYNYGVNSRISIFTNEKIAR